MCRIIRISAPNGIGEPDGPDILDAFRLLQTTFSYQPDELNAFLGIYFLQEKDLHKGISYTIARESDPNARRIHLEESTDQPNTTLHSETTKGWILTRDNLPINDKTKHKKEDQFFMQTKKHTTDRSLGMVWLGLRLGYIQSRLERTD